MQSIAIDRSGECVVASLRDSALQAFSSLRRCTDRRYPGNAAAAETCRKLEIYIVNLSKQTFIIFFQHLYNFRNQNNRTKIGDLISSFCRQ